MSGFVVAIDGPAASGKSTTARLVAERLGDQVIELKNVSKGFGDRLLIDKLSLLYNRSRQAAITGELIEIVSASEAM